jgi:hypothetical protein
MRQTVFQATSKVNRAESKRLLRIAAFLSALAILVVSAIGNKASITVPGERADSPPSTGIDAAAFHSNGLSNGMPLP